MTDKDGYYRFDYLKEGAYNVKALNKYFDDGNPTYYYKPFFKGERRACEQGDL